MKRSKAGKLEEMVQQLFALQQRSNRGVSRIFKATPVPGRPATAAQLDAFEEKLGFALPPSYRAFLALHDGYRCFSGQMHLPGSKEQTTAKHRKMAAGWHRAWGTTDEQRHVFGTRGERLAYPVAYFDRARRDARGEMTIVYLGSARDRPEKSADFVAFLKKRLAES